MRGYILNPETLKNNKNKPPIDWAGMLDDTDDIDKKRHEILTQVANKMYNYNLQMAYKSGNIEGIEWFHGRAIGIRDMAHFLDIYVKMDKKTKSVFKRRPTVRTPRYFHKEINKRREELKEAKEQEKQQKQQQQE